MELNGLFFVIGLVVVAIVLLPALLAGVFVIVVVANRADPDPSGRRPAVVYAFATGFVTLFVALFATAALVAALSDLIGSHSGGPPPGPGALFGGFGPPPGTSLHPVGDAVARGSVLSLIVAIVAGTTYLLHLRAAARATEGAAGTEPVARVRSSYISAVAFVCVLVAVVSGIVVLYDVFRLIAPGVFSPGTQGARAPVVRELLPSLYLTVAAVALLLMHLRHAPPPFRPRSANRLPAGPLGSAPTDVAPPSGPPEVPAASESAIPPTATGVRRPRTSRKTTDT